MNKTITGRIVGNIDINQLSNVIGKVEIKFKLKTESEVIGFYAHIDENTKVESTIYHKLTPHTMVAVTYNEDTCDILTPYSFDCETGNIVYISKDCDYIHIDTIEII